VRINSEGQMPEIWRKMLAAATVFGALAAAGTAAQAESPRYMADVPNPSVNRLDQIYYFNPHNTYDYGPTLTGWLDAGIRSLELDVLDTDWIGNAQGPYVSHDSPAHKNCSVAGNTRLGHCLTDIVNWMAAHPTDTTPILLFVDMK